MAVRAFASPETRSRISESVRVPVLPVATLSEESRGFLSRLSDKIAQDPRVVPLPVIAPAELAPHVRCQGGAIVLFLLQNAGDLARLNRALAEVGLERMRSGTVRVFVLAPPSVGLFTPRYPFCEVLPADAVDLPEVISEASRKLLGPLAAILPFSDPRSWVPMTHVLSGGLHISVESAVNESADFWLISSVSSIVQVEGHWIFRLSGPAPKSGRWIRELIRSDASQVVSLDRSQSSSDTPGIHQWRWTFRSKADSAQYLPDDRSWVFRGNEPVFRNGEWVFSGMLPQLTLQVRDRRIFRKAGLDSKGNFCVTANRLESLPLVPRFRFDQSRRGRALDLVINPQKLASVMEKGRKPAGPNGFVRIEDAEVIEQTLELGRRKNYTILIWGTNSETKFGTSLVEVDLEAGLLHVRKPLGASVLDGVIRQWTNEDRVFHFRCCFGTEHVFFQSRLIEHEGSDLVFELPIYLFELQRRGQPRVRITDQNPVEVLIGSPTGGRSRSYPLFDLSRSGCSVTLDTAKAQDELPVGHTFKILMNVDGIIVKCDVQVRYHRTSGSGNSECLTRVGMKFLGIEDWVCHDLDCWVLARLI